MKYYFSGIDKRSGEALARNGFPPIMPSPISYPNPVPGLSGFPDVISDSGAFSILSAAKGKFDLDAFADKYIDYIHSCPSHWIFVELDVEENGYSMKEVDRIYARLLGTGRQIIRVWHPKRGIGEFLNYCKPGNFFGLGSSSIMPIRTCLRMAYHAHQAGAKLHAFAHADPKWLLQVPVYSSDASSWYTSAARYGQAAIWDSQRMKLKVFQFGGRQFPKTKEQFAVIFDGRFSGKKGGDEAEAAPDRELG